MGYQSLKKIGIYAIIKKVKAGKSSTDMPHLNKKTKTIRTQVLIPSVTATIKEDCLLSLERIATFSTLCIVTWA
jgi:hypothetical protein